MQRALRMTDAIAAYRSSSTTSPMVLTRISDHSGFATTVTVSAPRTIGRADFVQSDAEGGHINMQWLTCDVLNGAWTLRAHRPGTLLFEIRRGDASRAERPVILQSGDVLVFPAKPDCDREYASGPVPNEPCTLRALRYGTPVRYRVDLQSAASDERDVGPGDALLDSDDEEELEPAPAKKSRPQRPLQVCEFCGKERRNLKSHQRHCWQKFARSTTNPGFFKKPRDAKRERREASQKKPAPRGRSTCREGDSRCVEQPDEDDDDWMDGEVPTVGDAVPIWDMMKRS